MSYDFRNIHAGYFVNVKSTQSPGANRRVKDSGYRTCQFVTALSIPGEKAAEFCGKNNVPHSSWCTEHFILVYKDGRAALRQHTNRLFDENNITQEQIEDINTSIKNIPVETAKTPDTDIAEIATNKQKDLINVKKLIADKEQKVMERKVKEKKIKEQKIRVRKASENKSGRPKTIIELSDYEKQFLSMVEIDG